MGGQAWANMQYLAGLRSLGHDVVYVEDCGESSWVYDWQAGDWTTDISYPAAYVRACLEAVGFGDRWMYRAGNASEGMPLADFLEICTRAHLLIMRAVPMWIWREEYDRPQRRIFIDVDPGFTQVHMTQDSGLVSAIARCERHFTIGQRIGMPDCPIPLAGFCWLKTLPPIALDHWPVAGDGAASHFTTVMRWQGPFQNTQQNGTSYGQKDKEFPRFLELPQRTTQAFQLALIGSEQELLAKHGWELVPGWIVSETPACYQNYIQNSRAEFAVPKHAYVATRGGWFSDRSVCYLASGRPVLIEDTGLGDWLPTGDGLLTFRDVAGAITGVERINAAYEHHRRAARQLAEEHFAAERVLPALLDAAMN